jgi:hypothetical protein
LIKKGHLELIQLVLLLLVVEQLLLIQELLLVLQLRQRGQAPRLAQRGQRRQRRQLRDHGRNQRRSGSVRGMTRVTRVTGARARTRSSFSGSSRGIHCNKQQTENQQGSSRASTMHCVQDQVIIGVAATLDANTLQRAGRQAICALCGCWAWSFSRASATASTKSAAVLCLMKISMFCANRNTLDSGRVAL